MSRNVLMTLNVIALLVNAGTALWAHEPPLYALGVVMGVLLHYWLVQTRETEGR